MTVMDVIIYMDPIYLNLVIAIPYVGSLRVPMASQPTVSNRLGMTETLSENRDL